MKKITIAWAPNAQQDDINLAVKLLFQPWKWFGNKYVKQLEVKFSEYLGQECIAFDSGRCSLYAILKAYGIGEGDEVALQAFTCVALPNPILWVGATPIYVDADKENYNIDLVDLEQKLTAKTKAIIVQYTFGISPDINALKNLCESKNILLIEDCCHNLGQEINGQKAGTIGDAAIFSFGMEKIISGTRGGMATVKDKTILEKVKIYQKQIHKPRFREILRGILNPLTWKAKESGGLGNLFYKSMIKLKLHDYGLTKLELIGKKADWLPYQLPNANAALALNQFKKIEKFNSHRRNIASKYYEELNSEKIPNKEYAGKFAQPVWLRVPLIVNDSVETLRKAAAQKIYLGNWYTEVIHCKDVDLEAMKYTKGTCPNAEWLSKHTINLPTHIGIGSNEVQRISEFLLHNT